jgi:hypothetical protein
MESLFLDYYHPFAGLCNQLYLITNHIHDAFNKNKKLYIHKVNIDIFKKERILACDFFNIDATNEKLKQLTGRYILEPKMPEIVKSIPKLCIYPVSSIEILNCLTFNKSIIEKMNSLKIKNGYYAVHFRLDIDAIVHYTFGKEIYNQFMDLCNVGEAKKYFELLDQLKIERYCSFLLEQYFTFILKFGFDKTWYISTSITKWEIHDPMVKYLKLFTDFITNGGGKYYIPPKIYPQRELNALVDLLILRDSECLIGFEGSSFSEGYCLKVNSIRKVIKEFLFVKEYP